MPSRRWTSLTRAGKGEFSLFSSRLMSSAVYSGGSGVGSGRGGVASASLRPKERRRERAASQREGSQCRTLAVEAVE